MELSLCSWILIVITSIYLIFSTYVAFKLYKKNYYFYNPILDEKGENLHDKYPDFNRSDGKYFSLLRLILFFPIGLIRFVAVISVVFSCYVFLR